MKGQWQKRKQTTDFMTKFFSVPSLLLPKTKERKKGESPYKGKNQTKTKPKTRSKTHRPRKHWPQVFCIWNSYRGLLFLFSFSLPWIENLIVLVNIPFLCLHLFMYHKVLSWSTNFLFSHWILERLWFWVFDNIWSLFCSSAAISVLPHSRLAAAACGKGRAPTLCQSHSIFIWS